VEEVLDELQKAMVVRPIIGKCLRFDVGSEAQLVVCKIKSELTKDAVSTSIPTSDAPAVGGETG